MERIRVYVEGLFKDVPRSRKARELQEELIFDLEEKYSDLITSGKSDKVAYKEVISGIGDIDELLKDLEVVDQTPTESTDYRKKTAIAICISIALFIVALLSVIVTEEEGLPEYVGICAFFILGGAGACVLVYHFVSRPKYIKKEETMVEEFKEWKSGKDKNKEVKNAISSIIWTLTVIVYLLVSFIFGGWHITWIIFIMAGLLEQIVRLIFKLGEK